MLPFSGKLKIVELLLKYGAVPNGYIESISSAVRQGNKLEVVKLLLKHKRDKDSKEKGLCFAAFSNELEILKFLLYQLPLQNKR